jgi:DNA polymerase-3 subunit chi
MSASPSPVAFYVINTGLSPELLACRLCRRVGIVAKTPLFVRFSDVAAMQAFDDLLWTFDASSFVPHGIDDPHAPICLGLVAPDSFVGCCLNLADDAADPARFERILEIIGSTDDARIQGRHRFRWYRQQGIEPQTFEV